VTGLALGAGAAILLVGIQTLGGMAKR
jgi:hypothetical protein